MGFNSFSVPSATDGFLNAAETASGFAFSYSMNNTGSFGDDVLILIKDGSGNLLYWYTETSSSGGTIPTGALGTYQGTIQIQAFQGTAASDGASSIAYNGSSPSYPTGTQFTLHDDNFDSSNVAVTSSTSADATSGNVTLDIAAPSTPAITSVTDDVGTVTGALANGARTNDTNLTVNVSLAGTGAVAGNTIRLYNGITTSNPLGTTYTLTATDISNGFANVQTGTLTNGNTYNITARISDLAGNQSGASSAFTVIEDTSAPSAPSITSVTDDVPGVTGTIANNGKTNDSDLTVRVSLTSTGAGAGDTIQLYNGTGTGSPLGTFYTLTAADISAGFANVQTGTLTHGTTYAITARITDAIGNGQSNASSAYTVTEDTAAPSAASITSVTDDTAPVTGTVTNGGSTNDTNLTVSVSISGTGAVAGDTVQLYNGTGTGSQLGTNYTLTAADISAGFANVQTGTLVNGTTYDITARVTDTAGNQSVVSSNTFTVTEDTSAPSSPSIASVTDDVGTVAVLNSGDRTNDTDLTVNVSLAGTGAVAGDTIRLYNGTTTGSPLGTAYTLTATDISNGFANVQTGTLVDGTTYGITARVTDAAGNQSGASSAFTVTEDTAAPSAPSIATVTDDVAPVTGTVANGGSTNDTDLTVKVSVTGTGAVAGDTMQLYDGTGTGNPLGTSYTLTAADITAGFANVQTGTLSNGTTYNITARITDVAGNQSVVSSSTFTVTEDTAAPAAPSTPDLSVGSRLRLAEHGRPHRRLQLRPSPVRQRPAAR